MREQPQTYESLCMSQSLLAQQLPRLGGRVDVRPAPYRRPWRFSRSAESAGSRLRPASGGWRWAGLLGLGVGLVGCIAATPPGPGVLSEASQHRLGSATTAASYATVRNAADVAARSPQDLRAQRKAIILAGSFAGGQHDPARKAELLQLVSQAVAVTENSPAACEARSEVGALYDAGGDYNKAGDTWLRNASQCRAYGSLLAAAQSLRRVERCPDLLETARALWSRTPQSEWGNVLNAVNLCSNALSLRQNLSFVPEAVRVSYLEELARQHREAVAAAAREQDRAERQSRAFACRSDCASAGSSCYAGCPAGTYHPNCAANCRALESLCNSHCN